jgi:hypothetical protein
MNLYKTIKVISLFLFTGLLFLRNSVTSYPNWDDPELEAFLDSEYRNVELRVYLNSARPYFVQRKLKRAILFYDLNPRFSSNAKDNRDLCYIKTCFQPDIMVIRQEDFYALKRIQRDENLSALFRSPKNVVIDPQRIKCEAESASLPCDQLQMKP